MTQLRAPVLILLSGYVLLLALWAGVLSAPQASILTYGVLAGLLALSLNVIMGYAGQISLAQASFLGVGGFVTGFVVAHMGAGGAASFLVSILASVIIGAAMAVVVGLPALRLRGIYLAIATFAFADAFDNYIFNLQQLTGLNSGVVVPSASLGGLRISPGGPLLLVSLIALAAVWLFDSRLMGTRHGRALLALRENEDVAASFGVVVWKEKLRAFLISGALAGLAGSLYAYQVTNVVKSSYALQVSLLYLIVVVVGGLGSRWGVVASGALFTMLPYWFEPLQSWSLIALPLLLIYTMVAHPGGLPEQLTRAQEKRELDRRRLSGDTISGVRPAAIEAGEMVTLPGTGAALTVEGVSVRFGGLQALQDVSLTVPAGASVGLVGPNGAGKSTLFNVISGMVRPTDGSISFDGRELANMPAHARAALGIGRTFQQVGLVAGMTVMENLLLSQHVALSYGATAGIAGVTWSRRAEKQARERARELLDEVGLSAYADLRVRLMSTGQQRLVELACAVACRPRLLLLDEPSAGMSPAAAEHLAEQLARLRRQYGTALLLVEHHIPLVMAVCETTYVLDSGRILAQGPTETAMSRPEVVDAYLGEAV